MLFEVNPCLSFQDILLFLQRKKLKKTALHSHNILVIRLAVLLNQGADKKEFEYLSCPI